MGLIEDDLFSPAEAGGNLEWEVLNFLKGKSEPTEYRRVKLLIQISLMVDLGDLNKLEQCIFEYGSLLQDRDYLGRTLFVRMTDVLRCLKEGKQ